MVAGEASSADLEQATAEFVAVRGRLFGIAYRMLGSSAEAEDIVQDAWLRWQLADRSAVLDPAAFLATTTTRLCLNALQSARARRETYVGPWLPEPVDTSADPHLGADRQPQRCRDVPVADTVVPTSQFRIDMKCPNYGPRDSRCRATASHSVSSLTEIPPNGSPCAQHQSEAATTDPPGPPTLPNPSRHSSIAGALKSSGSSRPFSHITRDRRLRLARSH
jgi:hypothetical protein